ncbi:MAG TPA: hypothetical protein VNT52_17310 [Acidimicrobiales bacterium]|nr:hypothetical protein [Acidimicrobiales bacterium]
MTDTTATLIGEVHDLRLENERLQAWKASLLFCPYCMGMVEPADAPKHVGRCERLAEAAP